MRSHRYAILAAALLPAAAAEFELAYVGPGDSASLRGLRLGLAESNVQGEFLGIRLKLTELASGPPPVGAIALFADRPGSIADIAAAAGGRAVFNLSDESDGLRSACLANALHVIPSARMKADAVRQWQARNPDGKVSAAAWHGQAVKFAARDLNRRYLARYGTAMDDLAWAGWFAARAVGDTLLRAPAADGAALLAALKRADGLDGQKGDPHSFRASGQLRQPLVLVGPAGELLGEAPVRGARGGLDSLGSSPCR
ncbi:MAG: hypothetical protein OXD30_07480 [Bryobacterales bacterium]|nr:hypothetical protein [Bryobacterales bacterium]